MGFRFPLFTDLNDFKKSLKSAKVININDSWARSIVNLTDYDNIDSLKNLVQSYVRPRDIDRIIDGFNKNHKMPMPIILQGTKGYHIMTGNTRTNTARIMGITPKALLVDISGE